MDKQSSLVLDQINIIALQNSNNISQHAKMVLENEAARLASENIKFIHSRTRNQFFNIQPA